VEYPPGKEKSLPNRLDQVRGRNESQELIDNVLKPKHFLPPPREAHFNYISDIGAKWHGKYFYFFSVYACPNAIALSPTFESRFARMESLGGGKFALHFKRHDEWVRLYDAISLDDCIKAIQDDPWFVP
jgi:hypothetical protein